MIGWPAGHSRSPLIHNYWIKQHNIAAEYRSEAVPPDQFGSFFGNLASRDDVGPSVTIPHKARALALADADQHESAFRHRFARQCHLPRNQNPALEIDLSAVPENAIVTDLIYAPLETKLLAGAKARGLRTVDGFGMFAPSGGARVFTVVRGVAPGDFRVARTDRSGPRQIVIANRHVTVVLLARNRALVCGVHKWSRGVSRAL